MDALYYVNWNIDYACSLNCRHCYSRTRQPSAELNLAEKLRIAKNLADSQVFGVNLGGGEPLQNEDTFAVVEYLSSRHINVSVSSSGWDIIADDVGRLAKAGLGKIILSLDNADPARHDAFRRKKGSYVRCVEAASQFVAKGVSTWFSTVITQENFDTLEAILHLAGGVGCEGVEFRRLRLQGNARNACDLLLDVWQEELLIARVAEWKSEYSLQIVLVYNEEPVPGVDEGCPCGKTTLCILDNGDIAPCVYNPVIFGNALVDNISEIWNSSKELQEFRTHFFCKGLEVESG
jgi:MoaA/NifB/PqqE/SkfB family radical SAM enzyme